MAKFQLPANLLLAAIHAAGHAHTMSDDGANISMSVEATADDTLFESDATYAVECSKEHQTVTITTIGVSTFANATVPAAVEADGSFCFNPTKMGLPALLRSFGQHQVQLIVLNEVLLNIYCGAIAAEANFSGLGKPIKLKPQAMGKPSCELTCPTDVFLLNLQSVLLSVVPPNGDVRILKGVHFYESSNSAINMVTTDKIRITRLALDVTHQEGRLEGITITTKVLTAYRSAVAKLIDKESLASASTTLTVGDGDRFFLCAESEQVKLCLQSVNINGKFPPQAKGSLTVGEADLKIGGCSAKALIDSFKPLATWAQSANETMCALYAEKTLLRVAFQSPGGYLMHFAVPATCNVHQPMCFGANVKHIMALLDAVKDVGNAPITFHVWLPAGKSPRIIARLPKTNPEYMHMMTGMTPPHGVDIYSWFGIPAPLYKPAEDVPKKAGKKKSADNAIPTAPTAAKGKNAKGKAATATAPSAAAPKGTTARKAKTAAKSEAKPAEAKPPTTAAKPTGATPPATAPKGAAKSAAKADSTPTIPGIEGGDAAK